jgi:hypothetical protein
MKNGKETKKDNWVGKMSVKFSADFSITDEELVNL